MKRGLNQSLSMILFILICGRYPEEFPLEEISILPSDFAKRMYLSDFKKNWEEIGQRMVENGSNEDELTGTFSLNFKSIDVSIYSFYSLTF